MNGFVLRLGVLSAVCVTLSGCKSSGSSAPAPTPAAASTAAAAPAPAASTVVPAATSSISAGAGPSGTVVAAPAPVTPPAASPAPAVAPQGAAPATNPPAAAGSSAPAIVSGPAALNAVPCSVLDVSLKPGPNDGYFDGMSHTGTYLVVTNRSHSPCSIPGLPRVTFTDANGPVATIPDLPGAKFMHPGPVVLPILLQPRQSVYATARWIDGPVFGDNLCYSLTGIGVAMLHDGDVMMPMAGQMCGERSKGVHYDLQRYVAGLPKNN